MHIGIVSAHCHGRTQLSPGIQRWTNNVTWPLGSCNTKDKARKQIVVIQCYCGGRGREKTAKCVYNKILRGSLVNTTFKQRFEGRVGIYINRQWRKGSTFQTERLSLTKAKTEERKQQVWKNPYYSLLLEAGSKTLNTHTYKWIGKTNNRD